LNIIFIGSPSHISHITTVKPLGFAGSDMAEVDMADLRKACATMVVKTKEVGISTSGLERIRAMMKRYEDVFRVRMGPDSPAKIAPMVIKMRADARPVRATHRRYSQPQVAFIPEKVKELVRVGALVYDPSAKWASPIVAAPKPGSSEGFRFTADLRAPNGQIIPMASAMPNLEAVLQTTEGSSYYAKIDMCHAYWQLPLDKESLSTCLYRPLWMYIHPLARCRGVPTRATTSRRQHRKSSAHYSRMYHSGSTTF
jgi:hypothetical protein